MRIAVIVHLYYETVAAEIAAYLDNFEAPIDIYVSTDTVEKQLHIQNTLRKIKSANIVEIRVTPNRGYDIAPFLLAFKDIMHQYDLILKIHGKVSFQKGAEWGSEWRRFLFDQLMQDTNRINFILSKFKSHPDLGIMVPIHWPKIAHWIFEKKNREMLEIFLGQIGLDLKGVDHLEFPSGSMFWFRPAALDTLFTMNLNWDSFPIPDTSTFDLTVSHAIERSFLLLASLNGFKWAVIPPTENIPVLSPEVTIPMLGDSGLFDFNFYLSRNRDVAAAGLDPLSHYYLYGHRENRNPSRSFETRYYKSLYGDQIGDMNPLLHYMLRGRQLGYETTSGILDSLINKPTFERIHPSLREFAMTSNQLP